MMAGIMIETNRTLTLESQLDSLAAIHPWLDALIAEFSIPGKAAFAIRLCLEESLSNVIRHGYKNQPGHRFTVTFSQPSLARYSFTIEDTAPHFSPIDAIPVSPLVNKSSDTESTALENLIPGGLGITLLRKFTSELHYEALPLGNRLTLTFASED
jgi:anti-sigma regulatory factor (Ser/Thr protein kinase)